MSKKYYKSIHLNVLKWFDITSTGTLKRKRVSKVAEIQFPLKYRILWQEQGNVPLIHAIQKDFELPRSLAWDKVKDMFNS